MFCYLPQRPPLPWTAVDVHFCPQNQCGWVVTARTMAGESIGGTAGHGFRRCGQCQSGPAAAQSSRTTQTPSAGQSACAITVYTDRTLASPFVRSLSSDTTVHWPPVRLCNHCLHRTLASPFVRSLSRLHRTLASPVSSHCLHRTHTIPVAGKPETSLKPSTDSLGVLDRPTGK